MVNIDFNTIFELFDAFPNENSCIEHLEKLRWGDNVISPFSKNSKVYKCKGNKYKCKDTGKYFNVKTGTLFDDTKIPLRKWFVAIWFITNHKKGISSIQLAKDIGVTQKTAWFMLHRIRKCFEIADEDIEQLENDVEMDETYVGGKNKNRHKNKKVPNSTGRSTKDKTAVMGMLERRGRVIAKVVTGVKAKDLTPIAVKYVSKSARINTDEWTGYNEMTSLFAAHRIVNHGASQYVDGEAHTNTIEGFWSLLKRGLNGIYHKVARKHLQKYVDEFSFRYNTKHENQTNRMNEFFMNSGRRTTYKGLIGR